MYKVPAYCNMTIKQAIEMYRLSKVDDGMPWRKLKDVPVVNELEIDNHSDFIRVVQHAIYKMAEEFNNNL